MSKLPARIATAIETRTGAPPGAGVARVGHCRRCSMVVLAGLDGPRCAGFVAVDMATLTADGELACLLAGRPTFRLWRAVGNRFELQRRDQWNVRTRADVAAGVLVVPEHRCGAPLGSAGWPTPPASVVTDPDADPPF